MDRSLSYNLFDVYDPDERFTIRRFLDGAHETIQLFQKTGRIPIVCVGALLHIEKLVKGMGGGPKPDHNLRVWLDDYLKEFGRHDAHTMLRELCLVSAESINEKNAMRIRMALERRLTCLPKVDPISPLDWAISAIHRPAG